MPRPPEDSEKPKPKRGAAAVLAPQINITHARQKVEQHGLMIALQVNTFKGFPGTGNRQIDNVTGIGPSIDIVTKINYDPALFGSAIGIFED